LMSAEYDVLIGRLQSNQHLLCKGLMRMGLVVLGGQTPIISVLVGDEEDTLNAGNFLFKQGYYVQSVTFPAVPYHAGVLRIQGNANHQSEAVLGLLQALAALQKAMPLPGPEVLLRAVA